MRHPKWTELLTRLARGEATVEEALEAIARLGTADLGVAKIDHHRQLRRGMPEVVLATGKSFEHLETIVRHHLERDAPLLVTRVEKPVASELTALDNRLDHHEVARAVTFEPVSVDSRLGGLTIVTAGTSDLAVAEEARLAARMFGIDTELIADVGVAGLHRLLERIDDLRQARVLIVVAGMEGALPSVVAGLVDAPVIAVPTSVGYGATLSGLTALAAMLSSCSGGVTVVNVDNGFGAACAALAILNTAARGAG